MYDTFLILATSLLLSILLSVKHADCLEEDEYFGVNNGCDSAGHADLIPAPAADHVRVHGHICV